MHPYQDIFMTAVDIAKIVHPNVFEYLPGKDAVYPFIFVGEQFGEDMENKDAVFGVVTQTVHFYSNDWKQRGTLLKLMEDYIAKWRDTKCTRHFFVHITDAVHRVLPDNSTGIPLMHGVVETRIHFQHKGE